MSAPLKLTDEERERLAKAALRSIDYFRKSTTTPFAHQQRLVGRWGKIAVAIRSGRGVQ